jgi:hypothetical protein
MPELVIDFISSLDGYAAAEGWPGWWGLEDPRHDGDAQGRLLPNVLAGPPGSDRADAGG